MLNPDLLNRRALNSPLAQFCIALILALMLAATGASAQSVNAGPDRTVNAGESVTLRATKSGIPNAGSEYTWGPNSAVDPAFGGINIVNNIITADFTFMAPTGLTEDRVLVWKITLVNVNVAPFFFEDTVTITVLAGDITIPVISLLGEASVSIELGTAYSDAGATAQDNTDGDITSAIVITNPVDIDTAGSYTIRYNVMDAAGNAAAEVTRTVTVTPDVTAPVISLLGDAAVSIELGTAYTDAGATAQDNTDGDITSEIDIVLSVDTGTVGSYTITITYNVMDAAGNAAAEVTRTVTVTVTADATLPVISLTGEASVSIELGTAYSDAGATAQDNTDGDITSAIVITNPVDIDTAGSYTIRYNVMDAAGNAAAEVTRTVTVTVTVTADATLPVISLTGEASVSIELGTAYSDAGATAQDNTDGDITSAIVITNPVDIDTAGSYTIRYNVMDAAGNAAAEVTRTVTVTADATAPTVLSEAEAEADDRPSVAPATTDPTGKTITLPTSEKVNINKDAYRDFTVTSTLNDKIINHQVTSVRAGSIILDVLPAIRPDALIMVSYNPGMVRITDQAGNPLASFRRLPVKNMVTTAVVEERVQKTVETINRFLHTRNNLILANQPKLSRRINRLQRGVGSEQLSFATGEITKLKPFEFNFLSLGSGNNKFSTSLDQITRAADHLQVMQGDVGGLTATHERRRFDVWFEGSFNKFNGSQGSGGEFAIAYLGADYLVSPDLLVGGLLQYDRLSDSSTSENYKIEGKGWMSGPYVTARLRENLYLDARVAYGRSDNDISPQGTYTDSFTSTRRLANISLSGEFSQGRWILRPNASLSYLADKQGAYTNTLGDTIPGQTVSSGQFRIGPNVSTQFIGDNGWLYEPSVTLDAIYSHAGTSGGLGMTPSPEDGWRARLEAGLGMTLSDDARLSLTGNYDGIGQSGFEAWGLGVNLDMKF